MAESNTLFNGIKFWLARKIPLRSKFVDDIQKNGGIVVPVERLADMLIVDHLLKDHDLPQNSVLYSYRFIELSVRNGTLEDKEKHCVGTKPIAIRPVGDQTQSTRVIRVPFTKADDDFLIDWISKNRQPLQGDKMFKDLEVVNNRHTWQSWRARWVKRLRHQVTIQHVEIPDAMSPTSASAHTESTAPLALPAHKDLDHKPHREVSRTQQKKGTVNRAASSTRRFIAYNHDAVASARRLKSASYQSEQYHPRSFRNIAPKPSSGENLSRPDQNSADSKSNPEQLHAVLARLTNDAKQSTNYVSTPISHPLNESSNHVGRLSSKSLQNGESDVLSRRLANGNHQFPSSGQILSAETNTRRHSHQVAEDADTGDMLADPLLTPSDNLPNIDDTEELLWREEVAVQIWADLLKHAGVPDTYVSEGTAFLIANAKIIRDLEEEAFRSVWDIWWQSRPEKTEEEWAEHFNQFCLPFYATHVEAFRTLYLQRVENRQNGTREGGTAEAHGDARRMAHALNSPELGGRKTIRETHVQNEQPTSVTPANRVEASPELGSKTQNNQSSFESVSTRQLQYATEDSKAAASRSKRARSSSEVPESPRTPRDTDTIISKRYRTETYDEQSIADRRTSASKPNGDSHFSRILKSTVDESSDENEEIQADIDRQLWLEEEDAEQAENSFGDKPKIPTNYSLSAGNISEDEDYTVRPGPLANGNARKEHGLQALATPKPPSISELLEPSNVPHNSRPFYEASESAAQGDFRDLMSHPNILPSIEEKSTEAQESNTHTHNVDNESESEGKQEGISEWTQRKLRKGHSEEILKLVLNASMMDVNLARKALPYYQKFNRLPNTKPGIWTEEDDGTLLKHSRKGKRALIEKHGREALDKRREYLETMNLGT